MKQNLHLPSMRLVFGLFFLSSSLFGCEQQNDSTDFTPLWENPNAKTDTSHVDSLNSYAAVIPDWMELIDFKDKDVWGGLLPDTFGVRNAILVKSYSRDSFENLSAFVDYVYGHVQPAQSPKWNSGFICSSKRKLSDYKFLGYDAYQMQLLRKDKLYYCDYILLESKSSFIWIDYTSTENTHDINQVKMFEFLRGFRLIKS